MSIGILYYSDNPMKYTVDGQLESDIWRRIRNSFHLDFSFCITQDNNLERVQKEYPNIKWVYALTPLGLGKSLKSTLLPNYDHPKDNVCYCFGPDGVKFSINQKVDHDIITIPATGHHELWSYCAGSIVLYDRFLKINYEGLE